MILEIYGQLNRLKLCENCVFPRNFHSRNLGEISVFYGVSLKSFLFYKNEWPENLIVFTYLLLTFLTEFLLYISDNVALHQIVVHREAQFLTYYQNFIVIEPLQSENETNKFRNPWKQGWRQSSTN